MKMGRPIDHDLLALATKCAAAAYDGIEGAEFIRCKWTATQAFILRTDALDVLVFPGTADRFDFLVDASAFPPVPYGNGWCHPGFALAHKSVWADIAKRIDPNKELLVTGHSLGGGLAEKSCDFLRRLAPPIHLITFGKPNVHLRCGVPSLKFLQTQLSVVHGSDIVTRLPRILYGPDLGQDMLYFDNAGGFCYNPSRAFMFDDMHGEGVIKDHLMGGYVERVNDYLQVVTP